MKVGAYALSNGFTRRGFPYARGIDWRDSQITARGTSQDALLDVLYPRRSQPCLSRGSARPVAPKGDQFKYVLDWKGMALTADNA